MPNFGKTKKVYRHFLYIDAEEVLNGIAGIEGGAVTERVRSLTKQLGGDIGLKFAVAGVEVGLGGKSGRTVGEQLKLKQTVHSTTGDLLKKLEDDGMAVVNEPRELDDVFENLVIKFDAFLDPPASKEVPARDLSLWERMLRRDASQQEADRRITELGGQSVISFATVLGYRSGDGDDIRAARAIMLQLTATCLVPEYRDRFRRRATVVGQVTHVAGDGRILASKRRQSDDGDYVVEEPLASGASDVPTAPTARVAVRPLCIFK